MANHPNRNKRKPFHVELAPGQAVRVTFADSDGAFLVEFNQGSIRVAEDDGLPDIKGRSGELYLERFGVRTPRDIRKGPLPPR